MIKGNPDRLTSPILEEARVPADWLSALAGKGICLSERTLRERANRLGACYKIGRAMLITPEHMDQIISAGAARPARVDREAVNARPGHSSTEAAINHLKKIRDAKRT